MMAASLLAAKNDWQSVAASKLAATVTFKSISKLPSAKKTKICDGMDWFLCQPNIFGKWISDGIYRPNIFGKWIGDGIYRPNIFGKSIGDEIFKKTNHKIIAKKWTPKQS